MGKCAIDVSVYCLGRSCVLCVLCMSITFLLAQGCFSDRVSSTAISTGLQDKPPQGTNEAALYCIALNWIGNKRGPPPTGLGDALNVPSDCWESLALTNDGCKVTCTFALDSCWWMRSVAVFTANNSASWWSSAHLVTWWVRKKIPQH